MSDPTAHQRARWDKILTELERRGEKLRQMPAYTSWQPWQMLLIAGAVVVLLLLAAVIGGIVAYLLPLPAGTP